MFKTTSGGDAWSSINNGLPDSYFNAVVVDGTTPETLYAASDTGGVFKSTDGGASWSAANSGLPNVAVRTLAIDDFDSKIIYAGTSSGIFKSPDGGGSWSLVSSGVTGMDVLSLTVDRGTRAVYAGTVANGVFRSSDEGATWTAADSGIPDVRVNSIAVSWGLPAIVYAGTERGVFRSTDEGASWTAFSEGLAGVEVLSIAVDQSRVETLYAAAWNPATLSGGVFKFDRGGSWFTTDSSSVKSWVNTGLTTSRIWSIAVDQNAPQTVYAGTWGLGVVKALSLPDLPAISGAPVTSIEVNEIYRFTPTASNFTNFSISNKPAWASFNSWNGALVGVPGAADVGVHPDIVISASNDAGTVALPAFSITVSPQTFVLSVWLGGIGRGSVSSSPAGIECIGDGGFKECSASFTGGTLVTLHAAPEDNFAFDGWGTACPGIGDCSVILNSNRFISTSFSLAPFIKIGAQQYFSLQPALTAAGNGAIIQARELTFIEDLIFSNGSEAILKGGYGSAFSESSRNYTRIYGSLKIRSGRLTVEKVVIK